MDNVQKTSHIIKDFTVLVRYGGTPMKEKLMKYETNIQLKCSLQLREYLEYSDVRSEAFMVSKLANNY